jgi:methylmalonyl-CoA/ethylmalonyl-CoA epimerase
MSTAVDALAAHFFQVAYVVRDIEASEAWLQKIMGVPAWTRMANMNFGDECSHRGRPADYSAHLSIGYLRDIQIELIEPTRGESLYTEFLADRGPGLHHVAFDVPDFGATVDALSANGLELLAKGRVGPGSEFAYFDCEMEGASVIEILGFDEGIRGFMEQLKQQSLAALESGSR